MNKTLLVGQRRRFLFYGFLNVLITQTALQLMLLTFSTKFATFAAQVINISLGFLLYGKRVFMVKHLTLYIAFRYTLISILLWVLNWFFIYILNDYGYSRNLSAIIILPFLALLSFLLQKLFVFRN